MCVELQGRMRTVSPAEKSSVHTAQAKSVTHFLSTHPSEFTTSNLHLFKSFSVTPIYVVFTGLSLSLMLDVSKRKREYPMRARMSTEIQIQTQM